MTWDFMWTTFTVYVFVAFMFMLILVLRDLFRSDSSGLVKAIWVIALVFLPIVTSIVYLIARGVADDGSDVSARMAQVRPRSQEFSTIGR